MKRAHGRLADVPASAVMSTIWTLFQAWRIAADLTDEAERKAGRRHPARRGTKRTRRR